VAEHLFKNHCYKGMVELTNRKKTYTWFYLCRR